MALNTKTRKTEQARGTARRATPTAPAAKKKSAADVPIWEAARDTVAGTIAWFRAKPAERLPLAAMGSVYGSGFAVHAVHASPYGVIAATSLTMFGIAASRKIKDSARAFKTYLLTGASGLWVTIAGTTGAIGPHYAMSIGFGVLSGAAYLTYRRDDVVREKISDRKRREVWPEFAHKVGIGGSFIETREDTRLGERLVVDTRGTGKRASSIAAGGDLAERIAEYYGLATSRIGVTTGRRAGQVIINIRRRDPWAKAIPHPRLDPNPEIPVPPVGEVDVIAGPVLVGQEPETGRPLRITIADEDGARRIMVIATPGSGKTVLLNDLIEWITASNNGVAWGADLTKAKEMRIWRDSGALDLAACGPEDTKKAALILALAKQTIIYRAANNPEKTFTPGPGRPYIFLILDEIDGLVGGNSAVAQKAREDLSYVTSKGRSEGVGVILVGQRGTAKWLGGADIRNIIDTIVLGTVARQGEVRMAIGDVDLDLPDMTKYGEGHKGVIVIKELFGGVESGRTFRLDDFDDIRQVATGRTPTTLEPGLLEHLGDAYLQAKGATAAATATKTTETNTETIRQLDAEVEACMPEDLREQWAARQEKLDKVREYVENMPTIEHEPDPRVDEIISERQRQFVEQAKAAGVPDAARATILELAGQADGVKNKAIVDALKVTRVTAFRYLTALGAEGLVEKRGRGPATAWHLVTNGGQGD